MPAIWISYTLNAILSAGASSGSGRRLLVQITHRRHLRRRQRHQLIGALQIMVLQRRLVDLREELILVLAVGLRRVEMLGALGESGVENGLARVRSRVGIVPQPAVTGGKQAPASIATSFSWRKSLSERRSFAVRLRNSNERTKEMNQDWQNFLAAQGAQIQDGIVHHFGDAAAERLAARDGTVLCDLSQFGTLRVSGEEAQTFLQNLLSNDIREAGNTRAQLSSLNSPKGRMLATMLIWRDGRRLSAATATGFVRTDTKKTGHVCAARQSENHRLERRNRFTGTVRRECAGDFASDDSANFRRTARSAACGHRARPDV